MKKTSFKKVAFIATYPPKRCGIATFTCDLIRNIKTAAGKNFEPLVVSVDSGDACQYTNPVKFEIRRNVKNDYICAADYLNFSHVDLISVQHEFGLFGGEAGSYLEFLLRRVNAPVITTVHTVLEEPSSACFESTVNLCRLSDAVIVMNKRGIKMLQDIYGIDPAKIKLIEHGIPDLPFVDSSYYKHKFGIEGKRTILTFGLLSKNKGIENMLRAIPQIITVDPDILYIILGATHPNVIREEGQAYRFSLQQIVKDLNIQNNVLFHNQFVPDEELHNFLCAADIYVTPYLSRQQLTSGTLAFAVGSGKAVISTPYWAAEELLADNRGKLVPFANPDELAKAIIEIIKNQALFQSLRRNAYDFGRKMIWPAIGKKYWKLLSKTGTHSVVNGKIVELGSAEALSSLELPEISLEHLKRITDDTGLFQHAKFTMPSRTHGYCTDDNARALIVTARYHAQYNDAAALKLFDTYLSFVHYSQKADGSCHNFLDFNRNWYPKEPPHDALGRTIWALGTIIANPPADQYLPLIKDSFDRSVQHVPHMSLRSKAYSILGLVEYLRQFPGASDIKRYLANAADDMLDFYNHFKSQDWEWFEDILAYDNAILPLAMYRAGLTLAETKYLNVAESTCQFILDKTYINDRFSFIGSDGWYRKGHARAQFDQQPIEAASTTMMLKAAYDTTGDPLYLNLQRKAFDWFLGENDLHLPVYDFKTKGCCDGLGPGGVNLNQGAESIVSFLLSLLCVIESCNLPPSAKKKLNRAFELDPTTKIAILELPDQAGPVPSAAEKKTQAQLNRGEYEDCDL